MGRWSLLLLGVLYSLPLLASEWGLEPLMRALAATPSGAIPFREERHSPFLAAPLVSRGQLIREADGRLGKRLSEPEPVTFWIDSESVQVERPGEPPQQLTATDGAGVAALIAGFRATLAGDRATLERHYELQLAGGQEGWRLTLVPRDGDARQLIDRLTVEGRGGWITSFTLEEASGEVSRMELGGP